MPATQSESGTPSAEEQTSPAMAAHATAPDDILAAVQELLLVAAKDATQSGGVLPPDQLAAAAAAADWLGGPRNDDPLANPDCLMVPEVLCALMQLLFFSVRNLGPPPDVAVVEDQSGTPPEDHSARNRQLWLKLGLGIAYTLSTLNRMSLCFPEAMVQLLCTMVASDLPACLSRLLATSAAASQAVIRRTAAGAAAAAAAAEDAAAGAWAGQSPTGDLCATPPEPVDVLLGGRGGPGPQGDGEDRPGDVHEGDSRGCTRRGSVGGVGEGSEGGEGCGSRVNSSCIDGHPEGPDLPVQGGEGILACVLVHVLVYLGIPALVEAETADLADARRSLRMAILRSRLVEHAVRARLLYLQACEEAAQPPYPLGELKLVERCFTILGALSANTDLPHGITTWTEALLSGPCVQYQMLSYVVSWLSYEVDGGSVYGLPESASLSLRRFWRMVDNASAVGRRVGVSAPTRSISGLSDTGQGQGQGRSHGAGPPRGEGKAVAGSAAVATGSSGSTGDEVGGSEGPPAADRVVFRNIDDALIAFRVWSRFSARIRPCSARAIRALCRRTVAAVHASWAAGPHAAALAAAGAIPAATLAAEPGTALDGVPREEQEQQQQHQQQHQQQQALARGSGGRVGGSSGGLRDPAAGGCGGGGSNTSGGNQNDEADWPGSSCWQDSRGCSPPDAGTTTTTINTTTNTTTSSSAGGTLSSTSGSPTSTASGSGSGSRAAQRFDRFEGVTLAAHALGCAIAVSGPRTAEDPTTAPLGTAALWQPLLRTMAAVPVVPNAAVKVNPFGLELAMPPFSHLQLHAGLLALPPAPPPDTAAALAAGYVPILERLLRQAGRRAADPSFRFPDNLEQLLSPLTTLSRLLGNPDGTAGLLAYGEPRAVAALVSTSAKVLDMAAKLLKDAAGSRDTEDERAVFPEMLGLGDVIGRHVLTLTLQMESRLESLRPCLDAAGLKRPNWWRSVDWRDETRVAVGGAESSGGGEPGAAAAWGLPPSDGRFNNDSSSSSSPCSSSSQVPISGGGASGTDSRITSPTPLHRLVLLSSFALHRWLPALARLGCALHDSLPLARRCGIPRRFADLFRAGSLLLGPLLAAFQERREAAEQPPQQPQQQQRAPGAGVEQQRSGAAGSRAAGAGTSAAPRKHQRGARGASSGSGSTSTSTSASGGSTAAASSAGTADAAGAADDAAEAAAALRRLLLEDLHIPPLLAGSLAPYLAGAKPSLQGELDALLRVLIQLIEALPDPVAAAVLRAEVGRQTVHTMVGLAMGSVDPAVARRLAVLLPGLAPGKPRQAAKQQQQQPAGRRTGGSGGLDSSSGPSSSGSRQGLEGPGSWSPTLGALPLLVPPNVAAAALGAFPRCRNPACCNLEGDSEEGMWGGGTGKGGGGGEGAAAVYCDRVCREAHRRCMGRWAGASG